MKETLSFVKYQGTGNDFVMIDDRDAQFDLQDIALVSWLCNRKFGIGADGLILISRHADYDFEMIYYNADGSQSLCGNGSRCAVMYAADLGMISKETRFLAIDGPHDARIEGDQVQLKMGDVETVTKYPQDLFIDTGSPHHISFANDVAATDVVTQGRAIRHDARYQDRGTNVNFVELQGQNTIYVRTYERGVEDETLSCGTGVTAASLAAALQDYQSPVQVKTRGGNLQVSFETTDQQRFSNIYLIGPAKRVFEGTFRLS